MFKKIVCVFALFIAICDSYYTVRRRSQIGDCARLEATDLGATDRLSIDVGLIPHSFQFLDDAQANPQLIRILSYQIVCETFGLRRGTVSSTSAIVTFECEGTRCIDGEHRLVRVTRTVHFHYDCTTIQSDGTGSYWPPVRILGDNRIRTPATMTSLQIPADQRCSACIPPSAGKRYAAADEDTHCLGRCKIDLARIL